MPKIRIPSRKASNKSCSELNFEQKSQRAHMSISPQSEVRGREKLINFNPRQFSKISNTREKNNQTETFKDGEPPEFANFTT